MLFAFVPYAMNLVYSDQHVEIFANLYRNIYLLIAVDISYIYSGSALNYDQRQDFCISHISLLLSRTRLIQMTVSIRYERFFDWITARTSVFLISGKYKATDRETRLASTICSLGSLSIICISLANRLFLFYFQVSSSARGWLSTPSQGGRPDAACYHDTLEPQHRALPIGWFSLVVLFRTSIFPSRLLPSPLMLLSLIRPPVFPAAPSKVWP